MSVKNNQGLLLLYLPLIGSEKLYYPLVQSETNLTPIMNKGGNFPCGGASVEECNKIILV